MNEPRRKPSKAKKTPEDDSTEDTEETTPRTDNKPKRPVKNDGETTHARNDKQPAKKSPSETAPVQKKQVGRAWAIKAEDENGVEDIFMFYHNRKREWIQRTARTKSKFELFKTFLSNIKRITSSKKKTISLKSEKDQELKLESFDDPHHVLVLTIVMMKNQKNEGTDEDSHVVITKEAGKLKAYQLQDAPKQKWMNGKTKLPEFQHAVEKNKAKLWQKIKLSTSFGHTHGSRRHRRSRSKARRR